MSAHRVTESQLFKCLVSRERTDGFDASQVSASVNAVLTEAWPVLQQVSRNFPLYTLHDPEHSFRVAENMYRIIPPATLDALNSIELSILLYSAYFHDIGMAASQDEFYAWLSSPEYHEFVSSRDRWTHALSNLDRDGADDAPVDRDKTDLWLRCLQDVIYTDYLRETHAARGADYVIARHGRDGRSLHRIQVGEVNYADEVALVGKSHWENAASLRSPQYRRDAFIGRLSVNLQYCAIVLRLADVAELDPERTPSTLLDFIMLDLLSAADRNTSAAGGARAKSAEEWAKHRAVLGYKISPSEIRIEARCSHPAIQRGLREWCDYIDAERRECRSVIRENVAEITAKYTLDLSLEVNKEYVRSDGSYIYADFRLQLDYDRIVALLMGTQLWEDPTVVLRELLQNALDACNHRAALSRRLGVTYRPSIRFTVATSPASNEALLSCDDNGTGMNQSIVERYLMRVGSSYYESSEFKQQNLDFRPISHFGLGVMSCFMLSDRILIDTCHRDESLVAEDPLRIEMDSAGRYVVLRKLPAPREGTCVSMPIDEHRLRLLGPFDGPHRHMPHHHDFYYHQRGRWFVHSVHRILEEISIHLDIPIQVTDGAEFSAVIEPGAFELPPIPREDLPCMQDKYREFVFDYSHADGKGIAGRFRFLLPVRESGAICLGCSIESTFKLFIDADGDLCLTAPGHDTEKLPGILFDSLDDWETDELRGVYRYKYGRRPFSERWSDGIPSSVLEIVRSSFRWSQDGLFVGRRGDRTADQEEDEEPTRRRSSKEPREGLFELLPVPGLNAADIDLRGDARLALNVQRTDFQRDRPFEALREKYYALAAEMWLRILESADAMPNGANRQLRDALFSQARQSLVMQLLARHPGIADGVRTDIDHRPRRRT